MTALLRPASHAVLAALVLLVSVLAAAPARADDPGPSQPTITGTPVVGTALTASTTGWPSDVTVAFQWLRDGTPVQESTAPTHQVTEADADHAMSVVASAEIEGETVALTSAPTERVLLAATPTIFGDLVVGSTIWAETQTWTGGVDFGFRWFADGQLVAGVTGPDFRLTSKQDGRAITLEVTGARPGYPTVTRQSQTSAKVLGKAPVPKISGAAAVGRTLTASAGSWPKKVSVRYQWFADEHPIEGATRSSYKVGSDRAGGSISVQTTGSRAGYATITRTSSPTPRVQIIGSPTLDGSAVATEGISVDPGTWMEGTDFTYSWYLNGKKIKNQSSSEIEIRPSWKGKKISAKVTGYSTFTAATSSKKVRLPGRTDPVSEWNCPSWAPIKGNADSGIYHLPRQRFYKRTKPEDCFSSESAARDAGYRKSKV